MKNHLSLFNFPLLALTSSLFCWKSMVNILSINLTAQR